LFIYCCVVASIVTIIGIIISLIEKPNDEFLAKKVRFYNKIGAPWFGKKEYLESLHI